MTPKEKQAERKKLRDKINKKMGDGTVALAAEHAGIKMVRMATGIPSVDIAIGGGFVRNSINILFGRSSQGKSTLALHCMGHYQRQGYSCAYIYTEGPVDETHLESCGVDLEDLELILTNNSEKAVNLVQTLAQSELYDYIVIDSIQGLVSNMVLERSAEERTMGADAFMCSQLVKKFTAATTCIANKEPWCSLTLINQGEDPMGGGPLQIKGGVVQQFFSVQSIEVRAGKGLTKTGAEAETVENKVGHKIHFKVRKNKTFPPFKSGVINYYTGKTEFGCGRGDIDIILSVVTCGVKYGIIKQGGAWITHNPEETDDKKKLKFNGAQAYSDFLRKMPAEEFNELRNRIVEAGLKMESHVIANDTSFEEETEGVVTSLNDTLVKPEEKK
jgi:recombination protein RecA